MKTIKENHGARGGVRVGAGRKPGTANTKTREIANQAAAHGITPLEYLLDVMRRPCPAKADAATMARYDEMRLDAAKAAAPYIHPRLGSRDTPVIIGQVEGGLSDRGRQVLDALARGRITPSEATTIMQTLTSQARLVESDELDRRLKLLEERQSGRN